MASLHKIFMNRQTRVKEILWIGGRTMSTDQDYTAADLSPNLLNELKLFEGKMREESNKELIVIAYEKEKDALN